MASTFEVPLAEAARLEQDPEKRQQIEDEIVAFVRRLEAEAVAVKKARAAGNDDDADRLEAAVLGKIDHARASVQSVVSRYGPRPRDPWSVTVPRSAPSACMQRRQPREGRPRQQRRSSSTRRSSSRSGSRDGPSSSTDDPDGSAWRIRLPLSYDERLYLRTELSRYYSAAVTRHDKRRREHDRALFVDQQLSLEVPA